ncbi:hydantoinase/oxoprolinase family protein [Capillimicrobium parvum]|uniref:Acetophenone carboxylase gamma subunit n=1 Tax=Capillimicrobium parvum TaxID=2884022 RepID=A0A9E7BWR9_9ACTN|nr:hydantoinase/oxoprolinase family protein [Capillimicrobium parvum]UGS33885.1 Acetophenone carboxylase gamma subunit [Capillimicrobium parvum]
MADHTPDPQYVVGIDIGGTGTDCVVVDAEGTVTLGKAFSTPPDFATGILNAVASAARELGIDRADLLSRTTLFLHSTTVAENAVVDGTLATAGLLVTGGFEDTLFAMRGGYGRWSGLTEEGKRNPIDTDKPEPVVPRSLIRGIRGRTDAQGNVRVPVDPAQVEAALRSLLDAGAESIGVSLIWSVTNPETEEAVAEVVRRVCPDAFFTASHEIAPIVGEYERTSTVALNARLGPVVHRYLDALASELRDEGFAGVLLVMQAYGGLLPFDKAARAPVGMIESGPVSGLVGSKSLGELIGAKNIIAADMGGTTFKVGVVRDSLIEYQRESMVLRYHYALPKMDIVSLGLAGGSIISIDPRTGTPQIGPQSAGSYPGPVVYQHGGTEPTIVDVDALLGYLNADYFFGGRESLDVDLARRAFAEKVAKPMGMDEMEAAAAMYKLANSLFHDLLHKTTVQRGLDPRNFALFSFGGTAGMHVGAYAEELGTPQIVVPYSASVHGAFGLITSDIAHEDQVTQPVQHPADAAEVAGIYEQLEQRMLDQLGDEGFTGDAVHLQRSVDMRYRRQVHILTVPVDTDGPLDAATLERAVDRFESLYREKYGQESAYREAGIEMVSFRMRGEGRVRKPDFRHADVGDSAAEHAIVKRVEAWVPIADEMREIDGYDFERLEPGNAFEGPAVVWTPITTVVVAEGQQARVDEYKNLVIATSIGRRGAVAAAAGASA